MPLETLDTLSTPPRVSSDPLPEDSGPGAAFPCRCIERILSVSACLDDHDFLRRILTSSSWVIDEVHSCHDAVVQLCKDRMPIIICDADLPDGTWKDMLGHLAGLNDAPLLIVASRLADESLWAEVLNLGGFDVLAKPFYEEEVTHVIETARQKWAAKGANRSDAAGVR